jgi:hypothetical protein
VVSRVVSHNPITPIPNLNDISSQDGHLFEPTNSYHAPTHDNNPSAVASSLATMTYYGKKEVDDGLQMKYSTSLGKKM